MTLARTRFRDIAEREEKERNILRNRQAQLDKKLNENLPLTKEEHEELARIKDVLDLVDKQSSKDVLDPLFVGMRALFLDDECQRDFTLKSHKDGTLEFEDRRGSAASAPKPRDLDPFVVLVSLTFGLLDIDAVDGPPVKKISAASSKPADKNAKANIATSPTIEPVKSDPNWNALTQHFYAVLGEAKGFEELARLVLPILVTEGDSDGSGGRNPEVNASEFANVMRELHRRGVTPGEMQLGRRVNEALNRFQHVAEPGPYARVTTPDSGINPPDLEAISRYNLVPENIRLMGPMIIAAMFDEMKAFQCVDYCVEANQRGELVLGSGNAGEMLYRYWRDTPNRISEIERRTFYASTLGIPGGEPGSKRNTFFNPGMLHLCSNVSELVRRFELDNIVRAKVPAQISQQQVRKAARDLAANLSLHGYGMAYHAARELQQQINFIIDLLSDPEVLSNFGARDMWQVIDQIATLQLGGARNTTQYQTLATSGTIITAWLAENTCRIMSPTKPLIDMLEVRNPQPHPPGQKAITKPNDYDFVNACELWLADSGIPDSKTIELAEVRESPVQTSRPIQMPSVVQDMLGDMGDLGVNLGRHY